MTIRPDGKIVKTMREKEIDRLKREEDDKILVMLSQRPDLVKRSWAQLTRKLRATGVWKTGGPKKKEIR